MINQMELYILEILILALSSIFFSLSYKYFNTLI